jgi:hypothetical protein
MLAVSRDSTMNMDISSSAQFTQHLESVGGDATALKNFSFVPADGDTVEEVALELRTENISHGRPAGDQFTLHALAEILISTRDEKAPSLPPDRSQPGEYQLEIYLAAGSGTRTRVPRMHLNDAKVWAQKRIDGVGASFGAIYFPTGGSDRRGTGSLVSRYDRNVGWYE